MWSTSPAASNAAKMIRSGGGFKAEAEAPLTIAQVELLDPDKDGAKRIEDNFEKIQMIAEQTQKELISLGGGLREVVVRQSVGKAERLVVHLVVDCKDAMGANMVNTMAEAVSPYLAEISGAKEGLRILTNLATKRLAKAECRVPIDALKREGFSAQRVADGVVAASEFAQADPYRASTHNKGIFNGIDGFLIACGNDWRAVEAGGHAFAAINGQYSPLTVWKKEREELVGSIAMPMAVGIVGGASKVNSIARACIELTGVETACELAEVAVCTGLASNLAALCALSSEGIQRGHMRLHERKL